MINIIKLNSIIIRANAKKKLSQKLINYCRILKYNFSSSSPPSQIPLLE